MSVYGLYACVCVSLHYLWWLICVYLSVCACALEAGYYIGVYVDETLIYGPLVSDRCNGIPIGRVKRCPIVQTHTGKYSQRTASKAKNCTCSAHRQRHLPISIMGDRFQLARKGV